VKSFFSRKNNAWRVLRRPERMLWLFDFDGTLAPIAKRPEQAVLPAKTKFLLRKLAQRYPRRVGVLSGRLLKHLKRKVGIPGLLYGGAHGFEVQGPHLRWAMPIPATRKRALQDLVRPWRRRLKEVPGLWMEDKKWTYCIHYGEVRSKDRAVTRRILERIGKETRAMGFKLQKGLQSVEIFSNAKWNKGQSVLWLKKRGRYTGVFYMGDDATDETVFRVLGPSDVGVRIGRSNASQADYYVKRQSQSVQLLQRILDL
jgi:trehalose 6-phosphate phosphatase